MAKRYVLSLGSPNASALRARVLPRHVFRYLNAANFLEKNGWRISRQRVAITFQAARGALTRPGRDVTRSSALAGQAGHRSFVNVRRDREWQLPRRVGHLVAAVAMLVPISVLSGAAAHADLKLCNSTSSRVGVAVGYQDKTGWATEGWWNIASQTCETLLKGAVPSRYIYIHALDYDRGGEWAGSNFMCTAEKSFAIRGVQDCQSRGYKRTGFFEVDTGESQEWTIRLTDPEDHGANEQ